LKREGSGEAGECFVELARGRPLGGGNGRWTGWREWEFGHTHAQARVACRQNQLPAANAKLVRGLSQPPVTPRDVSNSAFDRTEQPCWAGYQETQLRAAKDAGKGTTAHLEGSHGSNWPKWIDPWTRQSIIMGPGSAAPSVAFPAAVGGSLGSLSIRNTGRSSPFPSCDGAGRRVVAVQLAVRLYSYCVPARHGLLGTFFGILGLYDCCSCCWFATMSRATVFCLRGGFSKAGKRPGKAFWQAPTGPQPCPQREHFRESWGSLLERATTSQAGRARVGD
jgi:hypothetical protein